MANVCTTQILVDGARNAVVKTVGILDTSDLATTDIVDPANFTPTPTGFRIDRIQYAVESGITVRLFWDGSPDVYIVTLDGTSGMGFKQFGGLINNATTPTGKIQATTQGYTSGTQNFTIVLEMAKMGV